MNCRRLMIAVVAAAAAVTLLLTLHHRRTVDNRAQSASLGLRIADTPTATSVSSASRTSSEAHLSGRRPSYDPATTHASNLIDPTGNIRPPNAAPPAPGIRARADSPFNPPTQPNAKPQRPKFWQTDNNDGYTLTTDHEFVYTGSSSAVIESSSGLIGASSTTATFQACSATDFRGKHAQFTIYLRGDDDIGSAEAWLRVEDPTLPINVVRQPATLPSPPDWAPVSVTIDVSTSATILTYGVILHGPGPLRIDTAQLSVIDANGAIREEPARDPTAEEMLMSTGAPLRYPRNMDFEESFTSP